MLPKTRYARSDDVLIAYQVTGNGPVDVIWAPGTMSHLDRCCGARRRAGQRYMRAAASPSAVYAYEKMNGAIDIEAARDMASRIPGARFKEYPGNSHAAALDDMDVILADMQEFITGDRPTGVSDRILATVLGIDVRAGVHTGECEKMGDNLGVLPSTSAPGSWRWRSPAVCSCPARSRTSWQVPASTFATWVRTR